MDFKDLIDESGHAIIPDGTKKIPQRAFDSCNSLISVVIPESVKEIQSDAFCRCRNLKEIQIPNSVTEIGECAFGACSSLVSVMIPEGVKSIGDECFIACESLARVDLPKSLTSIGYGAFAYCPALVSMCIPDGVKSLKTDWGRGMRGKMGVFRNCTSLKAVKLPEEMDSIDGFTFCNCHELQRIDVPKGVSSIYGNTFEGCEDICLYLPDTVTRFDPGGNDAKELTVSAQNKVLAIENNCLIDKQKGELLFILRNATEFPRDIHSIRISDDRLPPLLDVEELSIPEGVTHIDCLPFAKMSKLKKLDLPLSIESCGWRFMEKYPLPTISVPLALLLHDSFTGWRDISKVELKGIDALDADSMERIKEKYKKDKSVSINKGGKMIRVDKSLCVYLNGQNVYPAAHIVKKKEETISLKPEKETREALEKKKKEMSEKLEDMTLAALCESKLGALGFDYRYNAKENFVKVVIKKRFIIGYKLTLTGSQEDISFLADVASSFRDALQGCNEEKVKLTAHDHGEYDGVNIGCPINDSNNTLILGLEPDAISVGLEAMLSFSSSLILLQQKYGEKMNSIEYYND